MVSIEGYMIGEYVFWSIALYVAFFIALGVQFILDIAEGRRMMWTAIGGVVALLALAVFQRSTVRIGAIMFVVGMFTAVVLIQGRIAVQLLWGDRYG